MRLARPLIRLPLTVDAARLAAEVAGIPDECWRDHPEGAAGNTAVPLVAAGGDPTDDTTIGPMAPTPVLTDLPYVRQILAGLGSTIGRSRLMRIETETELHAHVDTNYTWWHHLRVHIPVATTPDVVFDVGGETAHMAAGEVWLFDTWRRHRVDNPGATPRTHLVIDTVGGPRLWDLVDHPDQPARSIAFDPTTDPAFPVETVNHPVVMTPWELEATLGALLADAEAVAPNEAARARAELVPFARAWRDAWARSGASATGWAELARLRDAADAALATAAGDVVLANGVQLVHAVRQLVLGPALTPAVEGSPGTSGTAPPVRTRPVVAPTEDELIAARLAGPPRIVDPVFVVSPPRSGSSLLFETLARSPELTSVGGESHRIIESIPALQPAKRGWDSNRLEASDASDGVVAHLKEAFVARLRDREDRRVRSGPTRMLEKTPKNALRVPFLATAFPDARFVYLYRDVRETTSSMLDAWRSGRFVTYPDLPGWDGSPWSLLLVPGWRELRGRPLAEIVARQWATTTSLLLDDLTALEPARWCLASYDRLVADPAGEVGMLCDFLGLAWDDDLADPLPESRHTLDSPHPDKWRRNESELAPEWVAIEDVARRAHSVFADPPRVEPVRVTPATTRTPIGTDRGATAESPSGAELYTSRFTAPFAAMLREVGASLLVTTYQAGRAILVRPTPDGLNTHFRTLPTPMGAAFDGRRLAIGTRADVMVFHDQPAVAERVDPPGAHDACFIVRTRHTTGDIKVHDLAWGDEGLWVVNTRFSCLATLDDDHSFVPRWRPPFVRALAPEDRCHLNGLAVVDGAPRYVTTLGVTDEPGGWREHKAHGGALIDVATDQAIAVGLSMPHSPRWHDGRLWVLESGIGSLGVVDLGSGHVEEVARVPGFARGLAFIGPYALVGLSRVREHVFDGLPLTRDRAEELRCGVWVVDTTTGRTVATLEFEGLVQEIFDVVVLAGRRYPELVEPGADLAEQAFVVPDAALADVPPSAR